MKKALLILGISVIAGATTYAIFASMRKRKPAVVVTTDKKHEGIPVSKPIQEVPIDEVDFARKSAEDIITERHEEAAHIIKEAVDVICKRSEASATEMEELNEIASGLDDLLKEE